MGSMRNTKYTVIYLCLAILLGLSLGYAAATHQACLRYQQYDKQISANEVLIQDLEYRLKHCRVKYIWRCGRPSFEKKR